MCTFGVYFHEASALENRTSAEQAALDMNEDHVSTNISIYHTLKCTTLFISKDDLRASWIGIWLPKYSYTLYFSFLGPSYPLHSIGKAKTLQNFEESVKGLGEKTPGKVYWGSEQRVELQSEFFFPVTKGSNRDNWKHLLPSTRKLNKFMRRRGGKIPQSYWNDNQHFYYVSNITEFGLNEAVTISSFNINCL